MESPSRLELALRGPLAAVAQLEQRTRALALVSAHRRTQTARRVAELERDLARVALVVRALAELALERGLFTDAQLRRKFDEADLADGVFDASLDPKLVAPRPARGGTARRSSKSKPKGKRTTR
jgi:hypothetical protein